MTVSMTQHFVAYVGIDWADTKHDICVQAGDGNHREFDCIPHKVDRIDEWAKALHQRLGGPIAVAVELAKGPIVSALLSTTFSCFSPSIRRRLPGIVWHSTLVVPRTIPPMQSWHSICCFATRNSTPHSSHRAWR